MPVSYYTKIAAAFVRGRQAQGACIGLPQSLIHSDLDELDAGDLEAIVGQGVKAGLKLHKFKRTMGLPRVSRVLGMLRSIAPAQVLDIGSGRGVFLWPLLDGFPELTVCAMDQAPTRCRDIQAVALGGIPRLTGCHMDATKIGFGDGTFEVVTALEVLEHIPDPHRAICEISRVSQRFVIASVPSHADDNPQHIHYFDQKTLERIFREAGARRVQFEHVPGHLLAIMRLSNE